MEKRPRLNLTVLESDSEDDTGLNVGFVRDIGALEKRRGGDVATARRHLAAMKSHRLPDALAAYILLGHRSLLIARGRGVNRDALARIAEILSAKA